MAQLLQNVNLIVRKKHKIVSWLNLNFVDSSNLMSDAEHVGEAREVEAPLGLEAWDDEDRVGHCRDYRSRLDGPEMISSLVCAYFRLYFNDANDCRE